MKKAFFFLLLIQLLLVCSSMSVCAKERSETGMMWPGVQERNDPARWWILLSGLIAGVGLYSLHRRRINELLQLQTVRRDRIAKDLHDDIGSTLSNINMLSAITLNKLDKPDEAIRHLRRISEEVSYCSQALDDIIWSANSKNDTLEEAISRMRRYCAELFELSGNVACHLDMDEQFVARKLCMEQRRDIYLIYKEALNNIYKHAAASAAWIKVGVKGDFLELIFADNGKGFDVTQRTHRNGLKNMQARVEKWQGKITIHSGMKDGTRLLITLPIDHPNG
jgi:signal transduction histidine kinase